MTDIIPFTHLKPLFSMSRIPEDLHDKSGIGGFEPSSISLINRCKNGVNSAGIDDP